MKHPWSQTQSGKAFSLIDPQPEQVCPYDMAFQLAHINRYCGAAGEFSVAQHSILVADALPADHRLYGLLHDAHEYPMGDVTTPTQRALEFYGGPPVKHAFRQLKKDIDRAIYGWAGLVWPIPQEVAEMIHLADQRALVTEKRDLLEEPPMPWGFEHLMPFEEKVVPLLAEEAFFAFLSELKRYGLLTAGEV